MGQTQSQETTPEQQAAAFFRSTCCESCANTLIAKGYNRPDDIPTLQEKNLVKYGIEDGHLAKMIRAIEKLKLDSGKDGASDTSQPAASSNAFSPAPNITTNEKPAEKPKYDVMLSYNWAHQTEVKRIREALKSHGFSVWIDVEQMNGYIYDSMMQAILSSSVIVSCLTGPYEVIYFISNYDIGHFDYN
ncbi:hypothetical protein HK098_000340 [Nowakowskiella sp. JEL0407]|nr:hypothetical protein HK098_000340 [Nowakowskiella sp. JEL0407]